jgi:hypothetical protein
MRRRHADCGEKRFKKDIGKECDDLRGKATMLEQVQRGCVVGMQIVERRDSKRILVRSAMICGVRQQCSNKCREAASSARRLWREEI